MIDGRVKALARAHDQITDDHWGPAPLHGLIEGEAAACLTDSPRAVVIEGEPVLLNPQAYSTVALVIHELVTNSAKYGSLSNDGQVTISWHRSDDRDLQIDWVESGGPPVAPPTRKGFGTTIIEHSIPYDLGGVATLDYRPGGLTACFIIPERHLARPGDLSGNRNAFVERELPTELVRGDLLDGVGVLLVEDRPDHRARRRGHFEAARRKPGLDRGQRRRRTPLDPRRPARYRRARH